MYNRQQKVSLEEAKQMDMVEYLSKLGFEPVKVRNNDYWYLSPLRDEKTASFKVNRQMNRWYDHGTGKGGNIIDFACLYHNYPVAEFIKQLSDDSSFQPPLTATNNVLISDDNKESKISILQVGSIASYSLQKYLNQRRISPEIANRFCKEVSFEMHGKLYYSIGFKNDSGGYELRNPYLKNSSSPKDITTFKKDVKEVAVFEGFIDFLSFQTIHKNQSLPELNFVILNSVSMFERARPFMENHEVVKLYLDRDSTGQNYSRYALSLSKKYKDESNLYQHYKDLNEWLMNFGKTQKKSFGKGLH